MLRSFHSRPHIYSLPCSARKLRSRGARAERRSGTVLRSLRSLRTRRCLLRSTAPLERSFQSGSRTLVIYMYVVISFRCLRLMGRKTPSLRIFNHSSPGAFSLAVCLPPQDQARAIALSASRFPAGSRSHGHSRDTDLRSIRSLLRSVALPFARSRHCPARLRSLTLAPDAPGAPLTSLRARH